MNRDTLRKLGAFAKTGPYIAQAALAIVVAIERTTFSISDASRAIESMVLTAWSEGVGSNWVGFRGLDEVKSLLTIPDELEVLAIIPFGYPAQPIGKGKKSASCFPKSRTLSDSGNPLNEVPSSYSSDTMPGKSSPVWKAIKKTDRDIL